MNTLNYMRALEATWDEMKVWVETGRFMPENEESIQCFLYRGIVNQLGTAIGVRSKPTTDKPRSIFDHNGKLDVKDMHFPDFILGDPKEVVIEIKFARGNGSILGSCKRDVKKLKERHCAPGVSKIFILFDINPDYAFFNESQRAALQAIDPDCRLMYYPETLSTKTSNDAAEKAWITRNLNAALEKAKRSKSAKESWITRNSNKTKLAIESEQTELLKPCEIRHI